MSLFFLILAIIIIAEICSRKKTDLPIKFLVFVPKRA